MDLRNHERVNCVITDRDRDAVSGLSDEQWQSVVKLINASNKGATQSTTNNSTETLTGMISVSPSWLLDTGATHHMTGNLNVLENLRRMEPVLVILADGRECISEKEGTIRLGTQLILKSVFYVAEMKSDLISVGQLMDENHCVAQLADKFIVIQDRATRTVIGVGKRQNGSFYFRSMETAAAVDTIAVGSYDLWHRRLGHASAKIIQLLPNVDISSSSNSLNNACEICLHAKQTRDSFSLSDNKSSGIFHLIHCDVWGPYRVAAHSRAKYFLTIVDDYSRGVWIYLMTDKSETQSHLRNFLVFVERQFEIKVKMIRSDNGTEFMCMRNYFQQQGINHQTSCVGTPHQNGRVERKHRHILNVARALRFQSNLPIKFWGECVLTAGYLINRTPSSVLNGKTPYELLNKKEPTYSNLKVFGSLCFAHNQNHHGDKFASRTRRCVFVGYPHGQKGWRLYDLENETFFVSRDVVFEESKFPFEEESSTDSLEAEYNLQKGSTNQLCIGTHVLDLDKPVHNNRQRMSPILAVEQNLNAVSNNMPFEQLATEEEIGNLNSPTVSDNTSLDQNAIENQSENLGRGCRRKTPSVTLKGYITNAITTKSLGANTEQSSSLYPIHKYVDGHRFSTVHRAFMVAVSSAVEPRYYREAVKHGNWKDAMAKEIQAHELNKTWSLTHLPPGKRALGSQWVYKIKHRADGTIERYKARLVILGNNQEEGIDYDETFAPVAKMNTVRMFLSVAAVKKWVIYQMDVHNAFLHGDLQEEVYMKLPQGFDSDDSTKVCRLQKSLYGLKQAPRCWFEKLSSSLHTYGFKQSKSDYSLFTYIRGDQEMYVLIYVDDLVIAGNCPSVIGEFKRYLSTCFHMKDLGKLKYFLGIEVSRNEDGIYLSQRKYILDIISDSGLLGAKPAAFPMEQNQKLALSTSALLVDPTKFRRLVGRLIYLAVTRPELSHSVHTLAQFMQHPRIDHWEAAIRVVKYLKQSPGQGIFLSQASDLTLHGWCDSDWASCSLTRRSVTGYIVTLGSSPISWKTKKQQTVSRSSAEAEYRAMALLTQELIWLRRILRDLGVRHPHAMQMYSDSKSAIHIAANPVNHERTKHIEIDIHFTRDAVHNGVITIAYVPSSAQLADFLTKSLGQKELHRFLDNLAIRDIYSPA